ncbi:hypothetical protein MC7420_3132 [Coleofasciculus chthonoplastes PCC 7420]|uniref:Uncharacterized protein n=1 Tax=Coleofasciculus chthonoplastes PCC 7420 TaxID=118168 RepID=B4VJX6_9CYAN|nr:hypothetical protein [Coleofasciculus chthonoplastes]EDX77808.1 hypothetical protein MC7420_3132 [Coleofasciculus chthonoplastes PCC 7420]
MTKCSQGKLGKLLALFLPYVSSAVLSSKPENVRICKFIPPEIDEYYRKKVSLDTEIEST